MITLSYIMQSVVKKTHSTFFHKSAIITLLALLPSVVFAQGGRLSQDPTVINGQGRPIGGANIAVCQPLATTAASVTSNLVTFTMASNPQTAGFAAGMQILVQGFTGGDTYLNAGTLSNYQITNGLTVLVVTPSTVVATLVHANASATSNGTLLQEGNAITPCAGLSTIYTDASLATTQSNPFTSDGLGNVSVGVASGTYYYQVYGAGITATLRQSVVGSGGGGSGTPGGSTTQLQFNNSGIFGGASGITTPDGSSLNIKGPTPWADITKFGARAVGITVYPHTTVATNGCTATSTSVTLSGTGQVSTQVFQNGDGISLFGCGFIWNGTNTPAGTPGAPTVTNVVAAGGTALGGGNYSSSINATDSSGQGATTDNYQIVAADKFGGYTATSSTGSTTTGQATKGLQSCTISTESLSSATITVNFSSACYVSAGAMIHVTGTSAKDFVGWFTVATVNGGFTQLTLTNTPLSTTGIGGGSLTTSSTGGTIAFYYANHLKWTPVPGAWIYYIYAQRGGSGSYVLIGHTQPSTSVWTEVQFDDYGSPYMDNQTYPVWLPTSPPASAAADPLATTIVSGANTTSLVVANAAITSSSGGVATFDDGPAIAAACATVAVVGSNATPGSCFIPPATNVGQTYGFPIFSYTKLSISTVRQAGELFLYAPLEISGNLIDGSWAQNGGGSFSHTANAVIAIQGGGIIYTANGSQIHDSTINSNFANGGVGLISDGGSSIDWSNVAFEMNSGNTGDYLSQCFQMRTTTSGGTEAKITGLTCNVGGSQVLNKSWTPAIYIPPAQNGSGGLLNNQQVLFSCTSYCNLGIRGVEQEQVAGNGGTWTFGQVHAQGLITPFILFGNSSGNVSPIVNLNSVLLDTTSTGTVESVGNGGTVAPVITVVGLLANSADTGGIPPPFSGHVPAHAFAESSVTGDLPNYLGSTGYTLPQSILGAVNITTTNLGVGSGSAVTSTGAGGTTTTINATPTSGHCASFSGTAGLLADAGVTCAAASSLPWSSLTNPGGNLALTMGANTSTFTFNATTGTSDLFKFIDTLNNTGTGILVHSTTASGSTEIPFQADANGVGWSVNASGNLVPISAASIAIPGNAHGIIVSETSASLVNTVCGTGLTGQLVMATNGSDPSCVSSGITDGNAQTAVNSTPYTVLCDSATVIRDRSTTIRFQSGAAVVTMPDHTASGCGKNFTIALLDDGAGTLTVNRGGSDTFTVINGNNVTDGATSFTFGSGGFVTCNNGTGIIWECRVTPSVTYLNVANGGYYNGSNPITISANQLFLWGISGIPAVTGINHLWFNVEVADGTNNSAACVYNGNGTLAAHTAPATYGTTGLKQVATVETNASVTSNAGKIYIGFTSVAGTIKPGGYNNYPIVVYSNNTFGGTSGGACPASITPPADSPSVASGPLVLTFAP